MKFRVLGPLTVCDEDGTPLRVPGARPRTVLAVLLVRANRPVPATDLVGALWPDRRPASYQANLQTYVSRLRRMLPGATIDHQAGSYRLAVDGADVDLCAYREAAAAGRRHAAAGRYAEAARQFRRAAGLWRGDPLADVPVPALDAELTALRQDHWTLLEDRYDAELAAGNGPALIGEVTSRLADQPLRERLRAALMRALVAAGRPAHALQVYEQGRVLLADTLGADPGPALRRLHLAILRGDLTAPVPPAASRSGTAARDTGPAASPDPGAAAPFPVCQLPPDVPGYTGRTDRADAVAAALTAPHPAVPVAVVSGAPGVGKTAFAVRLAHRVRVDFPDGQLFVRIEDRDPSAVLGEVLRTLGVPASVLPDGVAARTSRYRSLLADRKVLVVLDDARRPAQVLPLLPGTAGCAVLVTGRHRLAGLAPTHQEVLDPLPPNESVAMIEAVLGADRVAAEPAGAARIAAACGYLPLALRVAGARLAARPDWTLARFADRLADSARRLDELSVPDLAVRAALADAYQALTVPDRRLLRLLAGYGPAEFAAWTASALSGGTDPEPALDRLVDANLLEPTGTDPAGQPRYRMHALLRDFGAERSAAEDTPADRDGAVRRLAGTAAWLVQTATAHIPDSPFDAHDPPPVPPATLPPPLVLPAARRGPDWLSAEYRQITDLVHRTVAAGQLAPAARLAGRITGHLWRDGHSSAMWHMYDRIHRAASAAGAARIALHARYTRAQADTLRGRMRPALAEFAACATVARRLDERTVLGCCLTAQGAFHAIVHGPHERAVAAAEQAVEVFAELGDRRREAAALRALGLARNEMGRTEAAAAALARAHAIVTDIDIDGLVDPMLAQQVLNAYVPVLLSLGQAARAREAARDGVRLATRIADQDGAGAMRGQLSLAEAALGNRATAVRLFGEVRQIARQRGNDMVVTMMDRNLAAAAAGDGRAAVAVPELRRCLATFRQLDNERLANETRHLLAAALRAAGDPATADTVAADAHEPTGYGAVRLGILLDLTEPARDRPAGVRPQ